jgi:hypothetical protein
LARSGKTLRDATEPPIAMSGRPARRTNPMRGTRQTGSLLRTWRSGRLSDLPGGLGACSPLPAGLPQVHGGPPGPDRRPPPHRGISAPARARLDSRAASSDECEGRAPIGSPPGVKWRPLLGLPSGPPQPSTGDLRALIGPSLLRFVPDQSRGFSKAREPELRRSAPGGFCGRTGSGNRGHRIEMRGVRSDRRRRNEGLASASRR